MYDETLSLTINRRQNKNKHYIYFAIKRLLDILISSIGLIILLPLFLIVGILIKIDSPGPIFRKQDRIGKKGKIFTFYKFRSMVDNSEEMLIEILKEDSELSREYKQNKKMKNDPRVTKVGKFIRKTSIDELPQLINILKGDMTLIGNRPYMLREKEEMGGYYPIIVSTKPGLTGLWQTSGRSGTNFITRCKMEAYYSLNMSPKMDIKIFFKTFKTILKGL